MYYEKVHTEVIMDEFGNSDRGSCAAEYGLREKRLLPVNGEARSQPAIMVFMIKETIQLPHLTSDEKAGP